MAERPIIFALANPEPEIDYEEAKAARPDGIVATGRSDYNNQVNNVLGFPFIFRGALDVCATTINEDMKIAAARALAELARREVPRIVSLAYGEDFSFGPDYIIPKPFDPRVLYCVAPAVAKAAVESKVATCEFDEAAYRERLRGMLGHSSALMRKFIRQAASSPGRVVFPEGDDPRILRACSILIDEGIAKPILLGSRARLRAVIAEHEIDLDIDQIETVDPESDLRHAEYTAEFYRQRQRKGIDQKEAAHRMSDPIHFGLMMVAKGCAEGLVAGIKCHYPDVIRPALRIIGLAPNVQRTAGMYLVLHEQRGPLFFADTTINVDMDAEALADVAEMVADTAKLYDVKPRIAMLSMSNFGSVTHPEARKVARATELLRARRPELEVEGEIQANVAINYEQQRKTFPFSTLQGPANVLIFPNLDAGNTAYKLMRELGGLPAIGPVLLGMDRSVTVLERDCDVDNVVFMTALTVVEAHQRFHHSDPAAAQ
jgi:malate dehydrogenase (oxaloacetate-decarboxylating)(NADP+)